MTKQDKIHYWIVAAANDWRVSGHLYEKKDYSYALFFGYLTIEKLLKALYVCRYDDAPPHTHQLAFLAEKAGLELAPEKLELLESITDFNLEARYPDEQFSFYKKCTQEFTEGYLRRIEEAMTWLRSLIPSSIS
ncbi:MAG: HEPN domain-containing protein [Deltaproteobacteria bacterium]|nr:HEPN domain-containing protein [Deltaproteobacteria bacterium]